MKKKIGWGLTVLLTLAIGGLALLPVGCAPVRGRSGARMEVVTNQPVAEVTFVLFDTETTGFSPIKNRLIEIAAVKFRGTQVLAEKSWLLNPGQPIPPAVEQVNHISDAMVKDQPAFKQVYPEFEAFIRDAVVMAHNAHFDVGFIREECRRNGLPPPPNLALDTLPMFRKWFPRVKSHNLDSLSADLHIAAAARHRAGSDTMETVLIFQKGLAQQKAGYVLGDLIQDARRPLWFSGP